MLYFITSSSVYSSILENNIKDLVGGYSIMEALVYSLLII